MATIPKETMKEIESHRERLVNMATRLVRNRDIAEDLVQETIIGAIDKLHFYDSSRGPMQGWLSNRLFRKFLDWKRSRFNRCVEPLSLIDEDTSSSLANKSVEIENVEFYNLLQNTLSPVEFKIAILLIEGFLQREIGDILGVSQRAVSRSIEIIRHKYLQTKKVPARSPLFAPPRRKAA